METATKDGQEIGEGWRDKAFTPSSQPSILNLLT